MVAVLGMLVAGCQPRSTVGHGSPWDNSSSGGPSQNWGGGTRPVTTSQPQYIIALGDSYSAGEGNAPYDGDAPGCDRGAGAWPRLLGERIPGSTVKVLACGGATSGDFTASHHGQPPQIDALKSLEASGAKPSIVTITVGGNDAGFSSMLVSCVVFQCFWTGRDTDTVNYIADTLPGRLTSAYSQVKAAAPGARIIVVGYPDLVPSWGASTSDCPWLRGADRSEITTVNSDLNAVIQRSARDAGVEYVSLSRAFHGHELCTDDSWVYPIGLNAAGPTASAHPNPSGQAAIAGTVYSYLGSKG
jgi:lysophospholipase L1-like esterase